MKPARHAFSRRAAAPESSGAAVTAATRPPPWASRETSRQVSVTAANATRTDGFSPGTVAKLSKLAWPVRTDRTPLSIAITLTSAFRPHSRYRFAADTHSAYARHRVADALGLSACGPHPAARLCPPCDFEPAQWDAGACSSVGQSGCLLSSGSRVRILPGAPAIDLGKRR